MGVKGGLFAHNNTGHVSIEVGISDLLSSLIRRSLQDGHIFSFLKQGQGHEKAARVNAW